MLLVVRLGPSGTIGDHRSIKDHRSTISLRNEGPMITKDQAVGLTIGQIIHYGECTRTVGLRGSVRIEQQRWRVSGKVKTWKTREKEFSVPIKRGLYHSYSLTQYNNLYFHTEDQCTLRTIDQPQAKGQGPCETT